MTQPASPAPDLSSTRLRLAILVLAYLAAHNLAYQFLIPTGVLAAIWPAAGMALAFPRPKSQAPTALQPA